MPSVFGKLIQSVHGKNRRNNKIYLQGCNLSPQYGQSEQVIVKHCARFSGTFDASILAKLSHKRGETGCESMVSETFGTVVTEIVLHKGDEL